MAGTKLPPPSRRVPLKIPLFDASSYSLNGLIYIASVAGGNLPSKNVDRCYLGDCGYGEICGAPKQVTFRQGTNHMHKYYLLHTVAVTQGQNEAVGHRDASQYYLDSALYRM